AIRMDIDCLNFVAPNRVVLSGRVTKSNFPGTDLTGLTGTFAALDNDTKAGPKDKREGSKDSKKPPDELSPLAVGGLSCQFPFSYGTIPLEHGKIDVRPEEKRKPKLTTPTSLRFHPEAWRSSPFDLRRARPMTGGQIRIQLLRALGANSM